MSLDPPLDKLLSRWEEARRAGRPIPPEELCRDCPDRLGEVRQRLQELLRLPEVPGDEEDTWEGSAEPDPDRWADGDDQAGPVRIVIVCQPGGLWARGGLGEVFVARDQALDRELALKRIQHPRGEDTRTRSRFIREARITGMLDHPGIVPVHGLGQTDDGRPCYAMRLVRGRTLRQVATQVALGGTTDDGFSQRELLKRFVAVCNTVGYAHSRGVVHRDIKPSNIMLGPFGETILLDWGLAKIVMDRDASAQASPSSMPFDPDDETLDGVILGTPAYMSPEQYSGLTERIGPASDIYGLGATLYTILTGRAPLEGSSILARLKRISQGDFPPPREIVPTVPKALEAICLKAMAREPEARYATALDLAADIERWLADEPVSVYRDRWPVRLGRWMRRHRTGVAAAGVLLVAAVVALAAGTFLIDREARRTRVALADARENFRLARLAVDEYCTKVAKERLLNEPGMEGLRQELLQSAVDYYEQFVHKHADDPTLRAELAMAWGRLGSLISLIDAPARAVEPYRRGIALLQDALRDEPGRVEFLQDLGQMLNELGSAYQLAERYDDAEAAYRAAIASHERAMMRRPSERASQVSRIYALQNLGVLLLARGKPTESAATCQEALNAADLMATPGETDEKLLTALGGIHNSLAIIERQEGRLDQAARQYRLAREVKQRLVREHPDDDGYRYALCSTELNLGMLENQRGRRDRAEELLGLAVEGFAGLAHDHPRISRYQTGLGRARNSMGVLLAEGGDLGKAETRFREAFTVLEPLAVQFPELLEYAYDAAQSARNVAEAATQRGDFPRAWAWSDRAIAIIAPHHARTPDEPYARATLLAAMVSRADAADRLGRHAEALTDRIRAVALAAERNRTVLPKASEAPFDQAFPADPFAP